MYPSGRYQPPGSKPDYFISLSFGIYLYLLSSLIENWRDREIFNLLIQSLNAFDQARLKPGARNTVCVSPMCDR